MTRVEATAPAPARGGRRQLAAVGAAVFLVHAVVVLVVRSNGWDDGAITLAFARTFADDGLIALTPLSPEVEGYSSSAWFLLMALGAKIGLGDFDTLIRFSQFAAAACAAAAAVFTAVLLRRYVSATWAAILAAATFCTAPFLDESMNGMEMSALTLVAVLICWVVARGGRGSTTVLVVLAGIASIIRLEATAYVVAAGLAVWVVARARTTGWALLAGAGTAAALQTIARLAYFGSVVPNTITAKRHPPYTLPGLRNAVQVRLDAAVDLLVPFGVALAVVVVLAAMTRPQPSLRRVVEVRHQPVVVFAVAYSVAVWGVNVLIGRNWGYISRMELSAVPLLVLAVAAVLHQVGVRWRRVQLGVVTVALVLGSSFAFQWTSVSAAFDDDLMAITPNTYAETGRAVDDLRQLAGASEISFLVADVGGTALCCPDIRILDLGLLANPELAADGYAGLDAFIERERPEVIEAHHPWSGASGIYQSPSFRLDYVPIVTEDMWLWVRADFAELLPTRPAVDDDLVDLRYRGKPVDEAYVAERDLPVLVVD